MNEAKGIAWTNIDYKGYKVSITVRGDGQKEAELALLGLQNIINDIVEPDGKAWADRNNIYAKGDLFEGVDEVPFGDVALKETPFQSLGSETLEETLADPPQVPPAPTTTLEDGSQYLGIKVKKLKVAECVVGQSYEILVDMYSADENEIRFYNEHAEYPACTHNWKSDYGKEKFAEIFPNWTPKRGSKVKLTNAVLLYIKGEGQTSEGNAYQNLKSAKKP